MIKTDCVIVVFAGLSSLHTKYSLVYSALQFSSMNTHMHAGITIADSTNENLNFWKKILIDANLPYKTYSPQDEFDHFVYTRSVLQATEQGYRRIRIRPFESSQILQVHSWDDNEGYGIHCRFWVRSQMRYLWHRMNTKDS